MYTSGLRVKWAAFGRASLTLFTLSAVKLRLWSQGLCWVLTTRVHKISKSKVFPEHICLFSHVTTTNLHFHIHTCIFIFIFICLIVPLQFPRPTVSHPNMERHIPFGMILKRVKRILVNGNVARPKLRLPKPQRHTISKKVSKQNFLGLST